MMLSKLFGRKRRADAAHDLYAAVITQARRPEFYTGGAVADTLDGRFDLLVLHAFLVLHRLGQGSQAPLSQALFDLMFADLDQNLREMGASDMSVGTKVKKMAKAFYGRAAAYQAGLDDRAGLIDALHRNLYRGAEIDEAVVAAMATYVAAQAELLAQQDIAELQQGRVRFGDPVTP